MLEWYDIQLLKKKRKIKNFQLLAQAVNKTETQKEITKSFTDTHKNLFADPETKLTYTTKVVGLELFTTHIRHPLDKKWNSKSKKCYKMILLDPQGHHIMHHHCLQQIRKQSYQAQKQNVFYGGYKFTNANIEKIKAMNNLPIPKTLKKLRSYERIEFFLTSTCFALS